MADNARIRSITIENFKGISSPVKVDLKPITLLFGKNSAGKSTILQAMLYALEVIRTGEVDIDTVQLGGDAIHLGGFRSLVHRHEADRVIKLRFDLELGPYGLESFPVFDERYMSDENDYYDPEGDFLGDAKTAYVTLELGEQYNKPAIIAYSVGVDDIHVASISDQSICNCVNNIHLDIFKQYISNEYTLLNEVYGFLSGFLHSDLNERNYSPNIIALSGSSRIIPEHNTILKFDRKLYGNADLLDDFSRLEVFFSRCLVRPMDILREQLELIRYIGPIRDVPLRDYAGTLTNETPWSNGLAAWDALYREEAKVTNHLVGKVNEYMTDVLNLGYTLDRADVLEIDTYGRFASLLDQVAYPDVYPPVDYYQDDTPEKMLIKEFESLPKSRRLFLEDLKNGIKVAPSDVGVGVSQVIPIIVGVLAKNKQNKFPSIFTVEQPELHIHPAVQCALGDLFIREKDEGRIFLLETHSEHLILRFLRRIQETTDQEIKDPSLELFPKDLGVFYVHSKRDELTLSELPVDETGEFTERWPEGFFEERAVELFGEDDDDV